MQRLLISILSLAALAPAARAQSAPDPQPSPDGPSTPAVTGKWDMSLYGFVELDSMWDSTQTFNDLAGNAAIARPGTYAGEHGQTTMSARNSRIGYRISAPTHEGVKASGQLELDFFGNQPTGISEAALFQNPTLRFRHANLKLETPVVDFLIGQYWELFGWQSAFHPASVDLQGLPGQVYSRAPQIRIGKKLRAGDLSLELAIAAVRPPQRASGVPDGQAGIKLSYDGLKGYHTAGGAGSAIDSAAIGVSAVGRKFAVNEFKPTSVDDVDRNGYGLSIDALIPIVPATKDHKENALTLTGSFVTGAGIADQYTGLSGGVANPVLPNPMATTPAPTYTPNVDGGLVLFRSDGTLHPIQWTSYIVGAQYYLPPSAKLWIAGTYSHLSSDNAHAFGDAKKVFDTSSWAAGDVFFDATPAVRLGLEYAWFNQTYVDGTAATDHRVQLSAWLIF